MNSATTLTLVDGVRIIVPDSLNLITTYVLREQEDWFEDEIKFLRHLLKPGQSVIDIGANYGVYTLSMAKCVGPSGHVWAFEPASKTASLLDASIAANNFNHIVLEQSALSSENGTALLSLHDNSELNSLVHARAINGDTESVPLKTLDECLKTYNWENIAFLKIDAEGEEGNILRGGAQFFASESPLVQYEIKAEEFHLELVQAFTALGYNSYRLVPGLDLLIPFDEKEPVDGYLLNLFACKPDRAGLLADSGFLVTAEALRQLREDLSTKGWGNTIGDHINTWFTALTKLPYGEVCSEHWIKTMAMEKNGNVEAALMFYEASKDTSLSAAERFAALEESLVRFKAICEKQPSYLRLSSLARAARDYGARSLAVSALKHLWNIIDQQRQADLGEPFLAPGKRFDLVSPLDAIGNWIAVAILEELERGSHFSSFYTGMSALSRLEIIRDLGFGSDEMKRRLDLIQLRFGLQSNAA